MQPINESLPYSNSSATGLGWPRKILMIAFEAWETEALWYVSKQILARHPQSVCDIFVADIFQINHIKQSRALSRMQKETPGRIFTLEEKFQKWQRDRSSDDARLLSAVNWIGDHAATLELTDHVFNHFERHPYYSKKTFSLKTQILSDIVEVFENVVMSNDYELFFSIDCQYFAKELANTYSIRTGIPYLYLTHSRIGDKWIISDRQVGLGNSTLEIPSGSHNDRKSAPSKSPSSLISGLLLESEGDQSLYESQTSEWNARFGGGLIRSLNLLGYLSLQFFVFPFDLIRRIKNWRFISPAYGSSPVQTVLGNAQILGRAVRYLSRDRRHFLQDPPHGPYVLIALHNRPEGSVLNFSRGMSEEALVESVARVVPGGIRVLVKENPLMVGFRRRSFYQQLLINENVVIVDPFANTQDFVRRSKAVLSVSGTALIEAELQGIPSFSNGDPHFAPFLSGAGAKNLETFLNDIPSASDSSRELIRRYCEVVETEGAVLELGWASWRNEVELTSASNKICDLLQTYLLKRP